MLTRKTKYGIAVILGLVVLFFIIQMVRENMQSSPFIPSDAEKAYAAKLQKEYEDNLKGKCAGLDINACQRKLAKPK